MASEVVAKARVAHHVPGRVRLRFERGTDVREVARRIEASVAELPGIRGIEVRSAARSVVVHHRPAEVEPERQLVERLAGAVIELAEEGARAPTGAPGGTVVGRGIVGALGAARALVQPALLGLRDFRRTAPAARAAAGPDAAEILRRRFARGELSRDELREMLAELETPGGRA